MKFTVGQKELLSNLLIVNKAVSSKNIQPLLSGIYLEGTEENRLILRGTDMELGIETSVKALVEETGRIVIPGKYFVEMVRRLPMADIEFETEENGQVKISYGKSEVRLNYYSGDEFPPIHDFHGDCTIDIKGEDLVRAVSLNQVVVSTDTTRPIFTGILLELKEGKMNFVSSDTHRLCHTYLEDIKANQSSWESIIPAKALKEAAFIINEEDDVQINITGNRILFQCRNIKVVSRLIEGKFVNYQQVIPREFSTEANILKKTFLDALERAFVLTRDELKSKMNTVKLDFREGILILSSRATEIGDIYEELPILRNGQDLELGFNGKYLIEILRNIEGEEITIRLNDPHSPAIIQGREGKENFLYLILPVRLQ